MSDTPQTDAAELIYDGIVASGYADAEICRKLERECNQLKADWNKACDEQLLLMLECDGHRAKAAKLREALQSVMDWNPKPEYWERPEAASRFEADMAKARNVLEETE